MPDLVDLFLTINRPDSAHPSELSLVAGVDRVIAQDIAITLQNAGVLREGVEVHYVTSEDS